MAELFKYDCIGNIQAKRIELTENELNKSVLLPGDLLFARRSLVAEGAGKCSLILEHDEPMTFESSIIRARPDHGKANSKFLFYLFKSRIGRYLMSTILRQVAVSGITGSDLVNLNIPIPSLKEQQSIAAILSCLDNKIDLLRRQNATLEHLAQTLFTRWFVEFEFPNEADQPYKSSGGVMVASEFGEIPAEWRLSKIGDEVKFLGGGTPSTKEPAYWEAGNIVWYSPTDLTKSNTLYSLDSGKHITELGLQKSSAKLFPAYSLLMTSRATVGEIAINTQPACTNQGFITLIPNENFSVYFLHGWLKTQLKQVRNLASGSTFPEISKSVFRNFDIIVPEQRITDGYVNVAKPIYQKVENNIQQLQTLTHLRDTLLPKLMSGQIRVNSDTRRDA